MQTVRIEAQFRHPLPCPLSIYEIAVKPSVIKSFKPRIPFQIFQTMPPGIHFPPEKTAQCQKREISPVEISRNQKYPEPERQRHHTRTPRDTAEQDPVDNPPRRMPEPAIVHLCYSLCALTLHRLVSEEESGIILPVYRKIDGPSVERRVIEYATQCRFHMLSGQCQRPMEK